MTIKELRKSTGLSQAKFSKKYGIPRRTLEDWEADKRTPPDYVVDMLAYIVASENVNHKAWVFYEYRDRAGTGSYELFTDSDAAIAYAKDRWHSMTESDQQSYLNDPVGEYIVAEMDVEWDPMEEKFEPKLSEYTPVWPKDLNKAGKKAAIEKFLKLRLDDKDDDSEKEALEEEYDGDYDAYLADRLSEYDAQSIPGGILIYDRYNQYLLEEDMSSYRITRLVYKKKR